jgi:hypothetical protein
VYASMGYIDFKVLIEKENETFDAHCNDEEENLVKRVGEWC